MAAESTVAIREFNEGDLIFNQGDPSGDLLFIVSGEVEIFINKDQVDAILTTMKQGEVIGTLTCMTVEPRLASARAKSHVVLKILPHENISKLIEKLPKWLHIVLKDFTQRLSEMNSTYSKTVKELELAKNKELSLYYTGAQLAAVIATAAELKKIKFDETLGVLPADILDFAESCLCQPRQDIDDLFNVFIESGMIKLCIEQEKKRKFFTLDNALKIKDFSDFVHQLRRKKIKSLIDSKMTRKETRALSGLIRYIEGTENEKKPLVKMKLVGLEMNMEKKTGIKFDRAVIKDAAALDLLNIEGMGEARILSFSPKKLSHTIAHISAYHRIKKIILARIAEEQERNG